MTTCPGPECDRDGDYAIGYCTGHYAQHRRGHTLKPLRIPQPNIPCTGPQCDRLATATAKLCKAHQDQIKRGSGVLKPIVPRKSPAKSRTPRGGPRVADTGDVCLFTDCVKATRSPTTGLCPSHLQQSHRGSKLQPLRTRTAGTGKPDTGLPAGWFKPSIRKPSTSSGQMKLAPETIGPPLPTPDWMRRHAMGTTLSRARSPEEAADFMSMIFGIENANTNPNKKAVSL